MFTLGNLLNLSDEQKAKAKVKFIHHNGYDNPIDLFITDPDLINKQWLYWREKIGYFKVDDIAICMAQVSRDHWLLTTIDSVVEELDVCSGVNYIGNPLTEYQDLFGRVVVKYHKERPIVRKYSSIGDNLEVSEILRIESWWEDALSS